MSFGDWPRICIQTKFAIQKAVITRVTLLKQFHFRPIEARVLTRNDTHNTSTSLDLRQRLDTINQNALSIRPNEQCSVLDKQR